MYYKIVTQFLLIFVTLFLENISSQSPDCQNPERCVCHMMATLDYINEMVGKIIEILTIIYVLLTLTLKP